MSRLIDLTGRRFGSLVVISRAHNSDSHHARWFCQCDCGNTAVVYSSNLIRGHTRSCGCQKEERILKHGMCGSPEYQAYQGMIDRCFNPNNSEYRNYGGRGITVCDKWREGFEAFYSDMGDRPSSQHSLDRIDVNGNYEADNCRWANIFVQAQNRTIRRDNKTGVPGVEKRSGSFRVKITAYGKIHRLGTFKTLSEAKKAREEGESKYWKGGDAL